MKKKIMSVCLIVALAAIAIAGGSLAYFTAEDKAINDFTVGSVSIEVTEPNWDAAVLNNENKSMYPGQVIKKDPIVTNKGLNPVFVRVTVTDPEKAKISYDVNTTEWIKSSTESTATKSVYYYYKKLGVTATDKVTDKPVFNSFTLSTATDNTTVGNAVQNISVVADAVQAQGSSLEDQTFTSANVADLKAWFNTCGK